MLGRLGVRFGSPLASTAQTTCALVTRSGVQPTLLRARAHDRSSYSRQLRSQLSFGDKRGDVTLGEGDGHLVGIASTFGRPFDIHAS